MDKQSSLLQKFLNYGQKKFYNIGPWSNKPESLSPQSLYYDKGILRKNYPGAYQSESSLSWLAQRLSRI